ncbi:MAG: Dihydrodipicolinate synthetase family [Aeromicrobium sp.]|nr:Dihydrodipicolinate synthetase family [Aeromicrobium sp.]
MINGVIPVAPTVFHRNGDVDLAGQRRVIDYVIDAGSSGICLLANYSEQFSLTDAERLDVATASLEQAAGRIPVVITTSHYSARVAAERSREAQDLGASMVMLMPPFFGATLQATPEAVRAYFHHVAEAIDIPIMLQDAPMSTTPMSVDLIASLAREIPHLQYVKIETPQAADKLRALRVAAGDDLPGLYDGEEGVTLIPDLDAGARGTMTSCMVPDVMGRIVRDHLAGDRDAANQAWEQVLPLVHFENRQCGLRAAKVLLHEGGVIGSPATRAPFGDLADATRSDLVALARRQDALILRWAS